MSEQLDGDVPDWDLPDRMRKALRHAGITPRQMARYLGVTPQSVNNWLSGRVEPSLQTLRLWSLRTGVSLEWVLAGVPVLTGSDFDQFVRLRRAPTFTPVPEGAPVTRVRAVLAA